jgi:nitrogen fixation/metabolism regulation signal transduction histidine kinase
MSTVTDLSRTRQRARNSALVSQASAQENLTRAFMTFTQAAGSLERSYTQLQGEVTRLHEELQRTNSELERSVEENARVRGYLSRVLENLPCGVLVARGQDRMEIINPEARKLLQVTPDWTPTSSASLPPVFAQLVGQLPGSNSSVEQEHVIPGMAGNRTIGILRANVSEGDGNNDTIWIIRDMTEQKRVAAEREAARRSHALAEVATVLAH